MVRNPGIIITEQTVASTGYPYFGRIGFGCTLCNVDMNWEEIFQYSDEEIDRFDEIIHSMAHLIMEFSQEGGFDNASNF